MLNLSHTRQLLTSWLTLILFMLTACTHAIRQDTPLAGRSTVADFGLEAQFLFSDGTQRQRGQIFWTHIGTRDELQINTRWGQGIAKIILAQGFAELTTANQQTLLGPDVEKLTREAFGIPLPLAHLSLWLLSAKISQPQDKNDHWGRPLTRHAADWRMHYTYPSEDPEALPIRLDLQHATGLSLQLNIETWYQP